MKQRPVLFAAIFLTLAVELVLIVGALVQVGGERLAYQLPRLGLQLILIAFVVQKDTSRRVFWLAAYHIVLGILTFNAGNASHWLAQALPYFHLVMGLLMYVHRELEARLKK
ncbi:hypothetical protein SAMN05421823_111113 [Catalinimonas alkaloidigena]|uniref:Uncharacterized protein n=1 Tax=Catalinimonas alkaloidigena TaxID=1075417 RepID=A0A1G9RCP6_9BACT|nr:hypothetical protein [Catalinimonas alkaloidigena]SDM21036.1 hypothetical protein SAMN05421823_111113 [Catalinimonas alkaloidigena]